MNPDKINVVLTTRMETEFEPTDKAVALSFAAKVLDRSDCEAVHIILPNSQGQIYMRKDR